MFEQNAKHIVGMATTSFTWMTIYVYLQLYGILNTHQYKKINNVTRSCATPIELDCVKLFFVVLGDILHFCCCKVPDGGNGGRG